jgi:hypothetical protein
VKIKNLCTINNCGLIKALSSDFANKQYDLTNEQFAVNYLLLWFLTALITIGAIL